LHVPIAAIDETGTICSDAPKASPCATDAAMRMPINEPGPLPKTIASRSGNDAPASTSSESIIGINRRVLFMALNNVVAYLQRNRTGH
jgi:hypothetical protein